MNNDNPTNSSSNSRAGLITRPSSLSPLGSVISGTGRDSRSKGGFAALKRTDPRKLSRIAADGGRKAHRLGVAHEWDSQEATRAGRIGGAKSRSDR